MKYLVKTASEWAAGFMFLCVALGVIMSVANGTWHFGPATAADLARPAAAQRCVQAYLFTACAPR